MLIVTLVESIRGVWEDDKCNRKTSFLKTSNVTVSSYITLNILSMSVY